MENLAPPDLADDWGMWPRVCRKSPVCGHLCWAGLAGHPVAHQVADGKGIRSRCGRSPSSTGFAWCHKHRAE